MSATVQSIDELVENFELLGDWESRFGYLIDLGKELPPLDAVDQCEENRVYGCQAQVWLKLGAGVRRSHHHRRRQRRVHRQGPHLRVVGGVLQQNSRGNSRD
ncbi:MAG: SufE family protein [Limisphaerales bacterium]